MAKKKESLLDLCTRATLQANSISVRMLEYLSTVKAHPHGFRELSVDFLDLCRILYATEAGLQEAARKKNRMPNDLVTQLESKLRQANDDCIVLNELLLKFLDYNRKGTFGKLGRGFKMMFADGDIAKIRESMARTRDALRMSAVVFRWSLSDADAHAAYGMGFTGLAAALERMDQGKRTVSISQTEIEDTEPQTHDTEPDIRSLPPSLPPVPVTNREITSTPALRQEYGLSLASDRIDRQQLMRAPSARLSQPSLLSDGRDSIIHKPGAVHHLPDDDYSDSTGTSRTMTENYVHGIQHDDDLSQQVVRLTIDPTAAPRWAPRRSNGSMMPDVQTSLMDAVRERRYKTLEQLLDSGMRLDPTQEARVMRQALLNRDEEAVRLLLLFGFDANGVDDGSELSHLHTAAKSSFAEGATMLIKYGADVNASRGSDSMTPLALSVVENKLDLVHLFLSYGGSADLIMANGDTTLIRSMNKTTAPKIIELMLKYGADPNAKNSEGKTALFEAIQTERIDLMTLLLDHGADPNLPGPKHMLWPSTYKTRAMRILLQRGADPKKAPGVMELATSIKNKESVQVLLEAGVSPDVKKDGTYTPLCSAIRDNSVELVSLLLANGANPNVPASEYPAFKCVTHHRAHLLPTLKAAGADLCSPKGIIETAVAHKNKDALLWLIEQGVNLNDRGTHGHTALTTAIREGQLDIVELLLSKGADPAVRGQDWPICMAVKRPVILKTLLPYMTNPRAVKGVVEVAVAANELESVKLLLGAGISVEDKTGGVFSPLTSAIRDQRTEMTRYLLDEASADPNAPGEHLPIIKALRRMKADDTTILEMLLEKGADINKMYRGWNAILQAVENGDAAILRLLIEKGGSVDLQAQDEESGKPVIDIVRERGWDEAVTMLLDSVGVAQFPVPPPSTSLSRSGHFLAHEKDKRVSMISMASSCVLPGLMPMEHKDRVPPSLCERSQTIPETNYALNEAPSPDLKRRADLVCLAWRAKTELE